MSRSCRNEVSEQFLSEIYNTGKEKKRKIKNKKPSPNCASYPKEPFKSIEQTREWMLTKVFLAGPPGVIGLSFNYAIVDKSRAEPQRVIGYVSINQVEPFPEVGYSVHPDSWGKGVATEALQLMLKMWWSLPRRNVEGDNSHSAAVEKAFALCEKKNGGSRRVLEKCGFNVIGDYKFGDDDLFLFAVERP